MELISLGVFGLILLVVATATVLKMKRPKNFPPGPIPLPLIGNLYNLRTQPLQTMVGFRRKYGDVFAFNFGPFLGIVLNSPELIKKYFNMIQVCGRPHLAPFTDRFGDEVPRGIFATEGEVWMEQRRFAMRNLREFGFGKKSMEGLISDEAAGLIAVFKKNLGKPIVTQNIFNRAVINSLYTICTGERAAEDDYEFEMVLKGVKQTASIPPVAGLLWFFPKFCKWFPGLSGHKQLMNFSFSLIKILKSKLHQHEQTFDKNYKRDLLDCYINEINNTTDPSSTFYNRIEAEKHVLIVIQDLLVAGSETTSVTLCWIFLILALHPEIQKKLQEEIDNVIGGSKPSLTHRPHMPYYQAFLTEVFRYATIGPLGLSHRVTEPIQIEGYLIPKGTLVAPNVYGVHHDEMIWGSDTDQIKPERFLSEDGKTLISKNQDAILVFGTGKRICPGEQLGRDTLFLFTTSIFQIFSVSSNPNKPKPTMEFSLGLTVSPVYHELVLSERGF